MDAFIFPGQGSQTVGMGLELAKAFPTARAVFAEADEVLGFSLSNLAWHGPEEELNDTVNTQPALLVHSIAALRVLAEMQPGLRPAFVAGHSLGEISALVCAGALRYPAALRLVRRRGELMKEAGARAPGGMAAVLGLEIAQLEEICAKASVGDDRIQVANDNCPGQVVVSGAASALERFAPLAEQAGGRKVVRLAVSIAAHSYLMSTAEEAFGQALKDVSIVPAGVPVVGNVDAAPHLLAEELEQDLKAQLTSRVRWTESVQFLLSGGVKRFLEIGTGSVLINLVKRISRESTRFQLGEPGDFDRLA